MKAILLAATLVLCGCVSTINVNDAGYITGKTYRISERVVTKVLQDRPDARPELEKALASLRILEDKPNITLMELEQIVMQIPQVSDSEEAFWIETTVLVFSDELGAIGIKNPPLLQAAVKGMAKGVSEALERR